MLEEVHPADASRARMSFGFPGFEHALRHVGSRRLWAIVLLGVLVLNGVIACGLTSGVPHGASSPGAGTVGASFPSFVLPHGPNVLRSSDGADANGRVPAGSSTTYNVTFASSGLPNGTTWSVNVSGTTKNASTNQIVFFLANGSYTFHVLVVTGYTSTPSSGDVKVKGAATKVDVKFSAITYPITFHETGLPAKKQWEVTLTPSSGSPISKKSTTTNITFSVANGSYNYSIPSISGYLITSGSTNGSVTVAGGSPAPLVVGWSKSPSSHHGFSLSLLDYLIIAVVAAGAVIGVVLILRRRKRKATPKAGTPQAPPVPGAPPASPPSGASNPPSVPEVPPAQSTPPVKP